MTPCVTEHGTVSTMDTMRHRRSIPGKVFPPLATTTQSPPGLAHVHRQGRCDALMKGPSMRLPNIIDANLDVILKRFVAELREEYAAVGLHETSEQTEARVFILQALDVLAKHAYAKEL